MTEREIMGIGASEGIAIGSAFFYKPSELIIPQRKATSIENEMGSYQEARTQARTELSLIKQRVLENVGEEEAAIFEAHLMMLDDPMFEDSVREHVTKGENIEQAVAETTQQLAALLSGMEDELFQARAADVKDVGHRILRILLGVEDTALDALIEPAIIVAHDLTPSDTANLDPELTLGFCTAAGGLTSHTAIIARTLNIPAVVGVGEQDLNLLEGANHLIVDGTDGKVIIEPAETTINRYQASREQRAAWLHAIQTDAHQDAYTADGHRIEVAANIGGIETAQEAVSQGAEGVGLLRTEFLYLMEEKPPDEKKQIDIYRDLFEIMGSRPIIVRTLDIGGDKPPSFLDFGEEENPFLGWRAIRICLDDLPLFKTQLRAILQAATGFNVSIMFPMINSLDELRQANQVLEQVKVELESEGRAYHHELPTGIMVETPAAAVLVDAMAEEAEFFSIGTNDLTQYTLAVDRTNARIAKLYQPLHPAVLRLIKGTIDMAHEKGKWVGMCGELAGMKKAIPILLGLGLDEFSAVPGAVPEVKWLIRKMSMDEARQIAEKALSFSTAAEVESYMDSVLEKYMQGK